MRSQPVRIAGNPEKAAGTVFDRFHRLGSDAMPGRLLVFNGFVHRPSEIPLRNGENGENGEPQALRPPDRPLAACAHLIGARRADGAVMSATGVAFR
jgi:hypothetical protein